MTAAEWYARAALCAADDKLAARLRGLASLCEGWPVEVSPLCVHKLLVARLPYPEGKDANQAIVLALSGVDAPLHLITAVHAQLWQMMSCKLVRQPAGLLQFQAELALILEHLIAQQKAEESEPSVPRSRLDLTQAQRHETRAKAAKAFMESPSRIRESVDIAIYPERKFVRLTSHRFRCDLHGDIYLAQHEDETGVQRDCPTCLSAGVIAIVPGEQDDH